MLRLSWLSLFCCCFLIGCAPNDSSVADSQSPAAEQEQVKGQKLPVTAQVRLGSELIELEVAQTPKQQAMGLMYREQLAPDRGMLFPLNPPRKPSFWMKNVKIPLDMIFVREGKIRAIAQDVPPCQKTPCPTYGPNVEIDRVIEVQGGRAKELGLEVGDSVEIKYK